MIYVCERVSNLVTVIAERILNSADKEDERKKRGALEIPILPLK